MDTPQAAFQEVFDAMFDIADRLGLTDKPGYAEFIFEASRVVREYIRKQRVEAGLPSYESPGADASRNVKDAFAQYPDDVRGLCILIADKFGFTLPNKKEKSMWIKAAKDIIRRCDGDEAFAAQAIKQAHESAEDFGLTLKNPMSIIGMVEDIARKRRTSNAKYADIDIVAHDEAGGFIA